METTMSGEVLAADVADAVMARMWDHIDAQRRAAGKIAGWLARHHDLIDVEASERASDERTVAVFLRDHWGDGAAERYHRLVAALPELVDLSDPGAIEPPHGICTWTSARVGPLRVIVYAPDSACERVQVGTRTVEKPDPSVVVPTVAVEEPVYEYRCDGGEVAS